jgi:two-component system response regulator PrrA
MVSHGQWDPEMADVVAETRWRLLVVDDDPAICRGLARALGASGFLVEVAGGGEAALRLLSTGLQDAVVLDICMPDLEGIAVVRGIRAAGSDVPVLILSGLDDVDSRIAGLAAGADDYVVKPFAVAEIELRLRAMLRRGRPVAHGVVAAWGLVVDTDARRVTWDSAVIDLTRREFDLLEILVRNSGIVLSREQLLDRVWGYDQTVRSDAVDTVVSYLRRKLETDGRPRLIQTVRGIGFALRPR